MERAPEMTECTGEVGGICWRDKRNVLARLMERTGEVGGLFVLLDLDMTVTMNVSLTSNPGAGHLGPLNERLTSVGSVLS